MKIKTCGLFIFCEGKFLICHPTGSSWKQWSIPKGLMDKGETTLEAAIRETREETGLIIPQKNRLFIELPEKKYQKSHKTFASFYVKLDEIPADWKPNCVSIVEDKGYPEIDKWKWIFPDSIETTYLHQTQQDVLKLIVETIK